MMRLGCRSAPVKQNRPRSCPGGRNVPQQDAEVRDPLRGRDGQARRGLAPAGHRDRRRVRQRAGARRCSARPARRSRGRPSSSTPSGSSSRSPRRRASSTYRPATPSTASTSAATRWRSARSTARRSCARATSAATRRWTTSSGSPSSRRSFPVLDSAGGVICEPNDTPLDSRHLDMTYALQTLTDKVYMGNVVSGVNARDTIAMGEILFGGREAIEKTPVSISLINCNSPLHWDDRMLESLFEYTLAGQPVRGHAVHPDGRDVPGDDPGRARAADRRGAVRHRAHPADPAGRPGDLRVVPLQHRHAVRLADVRHPRVGHRPAVHRPDRAALRAAVPLRRRAHLLAGRRTPRPATRR